MGFMGMQSTDTCLSGVVTHAKLKRTAEGKDDMKKLEERLNIAKRRLMEKEASMAIAFSEETCNMPGDRERRLILNAALAKICSQLGLKKEAGLAVSTMEQIISSISTFSDRYQAIGGDSSQVSSGVVSIGGKSSRIKSCNWDPQYEALVRRFRLDYDEWDISLQGIIIFSCICNYFFNWVYLLINNRQCYR